MRNLQSGVLKLFAALALMVSFGVANATNYGGISIQQGMGDQSTGFPSFIWVNLLYWNGNNWESIWRNVATGTIPGYPAGQLHGTYTLSVGTNSITQTGTDETSDPAAIFCNLLDEGGDACYINLVNTISAANTTTPVTITVTLFDPSGDGTSYKDTAYQVAWGSSLAYIPFGHQNVAWVWGGSTGSNAGYMVPTAGHHMLCGPQRINNKNGVMVPCNY